ncbi:MAG: hypothetical protein M3362_11720 [Acidobacteriota bacterium]|nr:hypothetical protein [Acidobacteriota bacterium]
MGKAIRASALILLLACSAQAGWMGNESPAPPPPSQPASATQGTTEAQEPTTLATTEDSTQGTLTQIALTLLSSVLP